MKKQKIVSSLQKLKENNQKVIDAIDQGKNVNILKAVRASLISNNILNELLIDFFYTKKENDDYLNIFNDIFGKK